MGGREHRSDRREPARLAVVVGSEVLVGLLLLALLAAAIYGYRTFAKYSEIRSALEAARQTVEYEPLSKVNDGSYSPEESGGRKGKVLDRVRSWRGRH